jgi:glycosyltransferase involved in cell wall biosynthesis
VVGGARGVIGFREQIIPSGVHQTGLHVDASSATDIAWGLDEALRDPSRWPVWGANGRERVLEHFTWAHAAQKTEAAYQEIVGRFQAGS